jgi:hypothetical protein
LEAHEIKSFITKKNVIQVVADSYKHFVDLIKPFMLWPCFEYKVRYRDSQLSFTTDDEARQMFEMYSAGMKQADISKQIGKSISVVSAMLRGQRKKHLGVAESKLSLKNTSGIKNVAWDKSRQKWVASVKVDGKNKNLGRFCDIEDAKVAVQAYRMS